MGGSEWATAWAGAWSDAQTSFSIAALSTATLPTDHQPWRRLIGFSSRFHCEAATRLRTTGGRGDPRMRILRSRSRFAKSPWKAQSSLNSGPICEEAAAQLFARNRLLKKEAAPRSGPSLGRKRRGRAAIPRASSQYRGMSAARLMPLRPGEQVSSPDDRTTAMAGQPVRGHRRAKQGEEISPINLTP